MSALNAELYRDREAYWQGIVRLIEQDPASRRPTPKAMRDVSTAVLGEIVHIARLEKVLDKYGQDIVETMAIGYMLIANEDWTELDTAHAVMRMDHALRAAQATRRQKGAEEISLVNVDNRVTVMTMGLATGAPEAASIRDYLFSQPPYQRVEEFGPLIMQVGAAMAGPKRRHAQAFEQLQTYAWKIGLGLGLLDVMGELPHHDRWGEPS